MSIESLKEQARRHEQKEEWSKALEQYRKALSELARDEQVDIALYNRVGDLYVRVGDLGQAVEHYEKAVDLYREAFLPNNAIAVCKKIIRNVPSRHQPYLKIGQIRAEQGFLPDARTNFLTYAERMQKDGKLDESFRALIEFCDLAPDDVGVRITVAEQMASSGRSEEAVEQLMIARQHLARRGDQAQVKSVEEQIRTIDPEVDLSRPPVVEAFGGAPVATDEGVERDAFGEITFGDAPSVPDDLRDAAEQFVVAAAAPEAEGTPSRAEDPDGGDDADFHIGTEPDSEDEASAEEEVAAPAAEDRASFVVEDDEEGELPTFAFDDDEEDDVGGELPMIGFDDDAEQDEDEVEIPSLSFDDEPEEDIGGELPMLSFDEDDDEPSEAARSREDAVEEAVRPSHAPPPPAPPMMPPATRESERSAPEPSSHRPPPPPMVPPPAVPPEAPADEREPQPTGGEPDGGYIDLGAMILGGGEEKTTRFTVAYEEPSGDEAADFARMLSQFKEKVSENLDSGDVRAHYDLGTAYKEMGLLDEAISSFQAALRASADHLPTYELMGQTFMEMGRPDAAVRSLRRALAANPSVEDELVGIYYYLARAYEELDDRPSALEFYDRVFALDINFADVTERLRALR